MKKFYRTTLLLILLIFLSTFNPMELNLISKKSDTLFKIKNIEIKNNLLIDKSELKKSCTIYTKKIFFLLEKKK